MYRVQRTKLLDNQKQKEDHRAPGNEEILPQVPSPQGSPRDEVSLFGVQFLDGLLTKVQASSSNW
jgi:hypothetical protein